MNRSPADVPSDPRELGNLIVDPRVHADPQRLHGIVEALRTRDPVCWMAPDGYLPFWLITRHADVQAIEMARDLFINAQRTVLRQTSVDDRIRALTGGRPFLLNNLVNMDGEEHVHHRKLTQAWFSPGRLKAMEPVMLADAREILDRAFDGAGPVDFATQVARLFPLRVIMRILGVPREDEHRMLVLTQQLFGPDDPDIKTEAIDVVATVHAFFDYFRALMARKRVAPADDLATLLAKAEIGEHEALSYFILVATAGHDTTSSTIAGGMLALLQNPEQYALLQDDIGLLPNAVEEMLRWVTPVTHFFRTATADHDLRGHTIRAGESVMLFYPSANRDEEQFAEPHRFRVDRKGARHLAFGYGPHVCLGQYLARLELRILFEELLSRPVRLELAGSPRWIEANFVGGLKALPVHVHRATSAADCTAMAGRP